MTSLQKFVLIAGPLCIAPFVVLWGLFPLYLVNGKWEHRSVFHPPTIQVGNSYARLSPRDKERMSKDPRQAELLLKLKAVPREMPNRAFWIGSKYGDGKNVLFGYVLLSVTAYAIALKCSGVL